MRKIRAWYEHPDNEPLRREVAWFRAWFFKWGWIAVVVLGGASVYEFLLFVSPRGSNWLSAMYSRSYGRVSPAFANWIIKGLYFFIFPQTILVWGGWLYLLHCRTLSPLRRPRRDELLLTPIQPREFWSALLCAPILWCAVASMALTVLGQAVVVFVPGLRYANFSADQRIILSIAAMLSAGVRECVSLLYFCALTCWVAWNCLPSPTLFRAVLTALAGAILYFIANECESFLVTFGGGTRNYSPNISFQLLSMARGLLGKLPQAVILFFIARDFWRRLTSPEARVRLLNSQ